MSIGKLIADLIGAGFGVYLCVVFYNIFWKRKSLGKYIFPTALCLVTVMHLIVLTFLTDGFSLIATFILIMFLISLLYEAEIVSRLIYSCIVSALILITEMMVALVIVRVSDFSIEEIQGSLTAYTIGMFAAKFFAFILIHLVKFFIPSKGQKFSRHFGLLIIFLPAQALILCFVIVGVTPYITDPRVSILSILALSISFTLIFIVTYLVRNQMKVLEYKQKYELATLRLKTQVEHYNEVNAAEKETRSIRHGMKNDLIIILDFLNSENAVTAKKHIEKILADIELTGRAISTGVPAVDAILRAQISRAAHDDIVIKHNIVLEGELYIDQFDIAHILANALDNAIEAIISSQNVDRGILTIMGSKSDYIFLIVENHTSKTPDKELKTTKADKSSHGFGIQQMKEVAEKYDGSFEADFDPIEQKFSLKILLKNRAT